MAPLFIWPEIYLSTSLKMIQTNIVHLHASVSSLKRPLVLRRLHDQGFLRSLLSVHCYVVVLARSTHTKTISAGGCKDRQFLNGWTALQEAALSLNEAVKSFFNSTMSGVIVEPSSWLLHTAMFLHQRHSQITFCASYSATWFLGTIGTVEPLYFTFIIREFSTCWSRNICTEKLRPKASFTCWHGQHIEHIGRALNYCETTI